MLIKISIIGAGVIGLTTAYRIIELIPDVLITIYYDETTPFTTSDVSAGFWQPVGYENYPEEKQNIIKKWAKVSYDRMMHFSNSPQASQCGVQRNHGYCIANRLETPFWADCVSDFKLINEKDLEYFNFDQKEVNSK
jgi:glycine/D-amino acid oxidase-like deaminating enzyme